MNGNADINSAANFDIGSAVTLTVKELNLFNAALKEIKERVNLQPFSLQKVLPL